jgi:(1->4)-alpha-D-glucan 1-alpha-D-glucosylmutase
MADREKLLSLARVHGIEAGYHDIWGGWHEASDATLRAILACMACPAHDDDAVERALRASREESGQQPLPPVIVRREKPDRAPVRGNVDRARASRALHWRIELESGEAQRHEARPACTAHREADAAMAGDRVGIDLVLPPAPPGYHRLALLDGDETIAATQLIVAPQRSYWPQAIEGESRVWGPSVQLYAVRSERNWGIGDFTDLRTLMEQWSARGADVVALNPLHALFPSKPEHASPYSPSSRLFLNPLYLDVERIDDFRDCAEARQLVGAAEFQTLAQSLRAAELVDHAGVAGLKLQVLQLLYACFRVMHLARDTDRARAFRAFQSLEGRALRQHALFEALQGSLQREDPSLWGWPVWPEQYRDPTAQAVARFEREQVEQIEFYEYLQWQTDLQLAEAGRRSLELGLGVGLYGDMAVSVDRGGAEAWANQQLYAVDASVGAPPDEFNMLGQNWGLPPITPGRLRQAGYAPFIALLRRLMRHMGALRIDHALGLMRLYWIPPGMSAAEGAYVRYPLDDLLGILALESERNRCLVVGEDLGTVPDALRERLHELGVLSYRLLYFERDASGYFKPPQSYPAQALVAASTHDLPTLTGFWEGRDIAVRNELGLFPNEDARQAQLVQRAEQRARLLLMLEREGLLPENATADSLTLSEMTPALVRALHAFIARAPSKVLLVQMEDVLGVRDQVNLPGTTTEQPNWRRKLGLALERWPQDDRFVDLCNTLREVRGGPHPRARPRPAARRATIPRATYRLQLNRDFTLRQAIDLVPYLARLGVSHVYCSPYLRARPGSTHGYDIVDHNQINPEIGTEEDLAAFVRVLHEHGMGQVLDIVPNHMGVMGADNGWWLDVLESGPASVYADFFDIDWNPLNITLEGKVLLPVLGDQYGAVLERGELRLAYDETAGSLDVWYFAHRFPIDPREYPRVLERALRLAPPQDLPDTARDELASLARGFANLPPRTASSTDARAERHRDKGLHRQRLVALLGAYPQLRLGLDAAVGALNGEPGRPESFDALHELIEQQAYRLAYWRVASDEINYRRFFDINDLAALRMENEAVFEATHRRVLDLLADGQVDGLRIDHPDGLYDPEQYFRRLQERHALATGAGDAVGGEAREWPLYVVVEKITARHERLPTSWPVHGSTGYRFANVVNGLFVEPGARHRLERTYRTFTGDDERWDDVTYYARRLIMRTALASELTVLATRLARIARADRRTRDFTYSTLRTALSELVACFPVYRTYVRDGVGPVDRRHLHWALKQARNRSQAADVSAFDFLETVLLAQPAAGGAPAIRGEMLAFTARLQQFTAPVTAKGIEDTAFYRHFPLASLNEVGGGPERFGLTVGAFHRASQVRLRDWPHTMLATTTHDTKRSEDVRTRIDVLSEMTGPWRLALRRWSRMNRSRKRRVDGTEAPSRRDEYLLYQTLIGTVPVDGMDDAGLAVYRERIERYMLKAVREAKLHTSWINANAAYEQALVEFVRGLLGRRENNMFLDDFITSVRPIARFGLLNSLSQTVIKLTSPGVPDIYRGTESWDFSLVDPDNRRPVDYARLSGLLDEVSGWDAGADQGLARRVSALLDTLDDGRAKLYLTWRVLALRSARAALFRDGGYRPLTVTGAQAPHVCAYARTLGDELAVTIAPRLFASLPGAGENLPLGPRTWEDSAVLLDGLPESLPLTDVLSGQSLTAHGTPSGIPLREALAHFPVAVLATRDPTGG